jgi:tetratricopeptide (TPR) repeat protein
MHCHSSSVLLMNSSTEMIHNNNKSPTMLLQSVLRDLETTKDQIKLAETYNSLGLIRLHMQKDPLGALECHTQAKELLIRISNKEDDDVEELLAITYSDVGYCHERLSETDQAVIQYKLAQAKLSQVLSPDHPRMISVQRAMDRVLRMSSPVATSLSLSSSC